MGKNILVIGGTRYVGKLLVQRLLQAGHAVTVATRGNAPDPFGARIARIKVDRRDEGAMTRAFAGLPVWDVIYDQMCYSPLDAAVAVRAFKGKVTRYVMASTIDVYRGLLGSTAPFAEDELAVMATPIDAGYPWHDSRLATRSYVAGKLQAEAYLYRDGTLPLATVRLAHVLGGPEDFTHRLAHYVDMVRGHAPLRYSNAAAGTSFTSAPRAADFLLWAGAQEFTGPVNAACDGPVSAFDIYQRIGALVGEPVKTLPVAPPAAPGELSPFDYPAPFWMDTSRATGLGYRFGHSEDWLDQVILRHDLAFV
jgi:nucleoside-diphosphate-sugar epimerase